MIHKRTYEGSREDRDHLPNVGGHHVAYKLLGVGVDDSALPDGHHLHMSRASQGDSHHTQNHSMYTATNAEHKFYNLAVMERR